MKTIIVALTMILSTQAFAYDYSGTCIFEDENRSFKVLVDKEVNEHFRFNRFEINMIKEVFGAFDEVTSFADIRDYFADGYDEMSLQKVKDLSTGKTYYFVWHYPGDNMSGIYFDHEGHPVAYNGDGDIYDCKVKVQK